jgi:hypothetical protein
MFDKTESNCVTITCKILKDYIRSFFPGSALIQIMLKFQTKFKLRKANKLSLFSLKEYTDVV